MKFSFQVASLNVLALLSLYVFSLFIQFSYYSWVRDYFVKPSHALYTLKWKGDLNISDYIDYCKNGFCDESIKYLQDNKLSLYRSHLNEDDVYIFKMTSFVVFRKYGDLTNIFVEVFFGD